MVGALGGAAETLELQRRPVYSGGGRGRWWGGRQEPVNPDRGDRGLALFAACCLRVSVLAARPCWGGEQTPQSRTELRIWRQGTVAWQPCSPPRKSRQREPSHPIRQRPDRQTQTQTSAGGSHIPSLPAPQEEEAL